MIHKILLLLVFYGSLSSKLLGAAFRPYLVSTTPQVTQLVCEIGLCPLLVGAPDGWMPNHVGKIRSIGSFSAVSFEAIIRLKPDLVLMDSQWEFSDLKEGLSSFKIPTHTIDFKSVNALRISLSEVMKKLGEPWMGVLWRKRLTCLEQVEKAKNMTKESFLIVASMDPLIAFGSSTFLSSLLESGGGKNLAKSPFQFPQLSREWLKLNPPSIIYSLDGIGNSDFKVKVLESDVFSRVTFQMIQNLSKIGIEVPQVCFEK